MSKESQDLFRENFIWGRQPHYARGAWIKIARANDREEIAFRWRQGFELRFGSLQTSKTP